MRPVDLRDNPVAIVGMDQIHERAGPRLGVHILSRYGLVPPENLALLRREIDDVGEVVMIENADLRRADGLTKALFIRAQRQLRRLESRDVPDDALRFRDAPVAVANRLQHCAEPELTVLDVHLVLADEALARLDHLPNALAILGGQMWREQVVDGFADQLSGRAAEHPRRSGVGKQVPAL